MLDDSPLTLSLVRRGARRTLGAVGRSLHAMDRDRRAVLAAALAMLAVLCLPWYEVGATARGADGTRHALRQALTGWQALSAAGVVCALVAVGSFVLLLVRSGTVVDGLGVEGRRAARARVDGGLIAGAGGLAVVVALVGVAIHPGPHIALAGVTGVTSVRVGLVLALLVALVLAGLGARIALAADGALPRWSRPRPRSRRRAGSRSSEPDGAGVAPVAEEMPRFDFVVRR